MKRLCQLAVVIIALLSCGRGAHAAVCATVASGASTSAIQTALNACGSGNTLMFANVGSWTISGTHLNIPCGVSVSGPSIPWPGPWTASFISSLGADWAFYLPSNACTTPMTISNINCDGGEPSGGGGGCVYFPTSGGSNITITNFFFHGNQASTTTSHTQSSLIWIDGVNNSSNNTWSALTVNWGFLGSGSDCSNVMALYNYQGANYDSAGGQCAGIGIHSSTTNLVLEHLVIAHQEQGMKFYEGSGQNNPCTTVQYCDNNSSIRYNDFSYIHRIVIEAQATPAPNMYFEYNSVHDQVNPGFGSWQFSIPQYSNNGQTVNTYGRYNVMLGNVAPTSGGGNYFPSAFELWGTGAADYNLVQGKMACGIDYGYGAAPWSISHNVIQVTTGNSPICNEEGQSNTPTETGNTSSVVATTTPLTSVTPTISPASGTFTGSQVVTFSCAACTLRDANTGIWYTTDGTTPSPGGSTSHYIAIGGTITITASTTIRAIGMWGAFNQPTTYPTGYGYVPSSVVTAVLSSGGSFFISPSGSDSNNGTSASTPWLTPNHAMTCGSTIAAASGTYSAGNFGSGKWGTVTCPAGNNVAWLKCATFDACKISVGGQSGMQISSPYWGVQGWEVSTTTPGYACFNVQVGAGQSVHHVIFANNVANGCFGGGFQTYSGSSSGIADYIVMIGNIAYNASQGSDACHSGFTLGFISPSDTVAGTHLYIAGNFSWSNLDPNPCAGTTPTDGEGLILDTLSQYNYNQQVVAQNNIFVHNGGRGIEVGHNASSTAPAPVVIKNNTVYGSNIQAGQDFPLGNGEISIVPAFNTTVTGNLAMTSQATTSGDAIYAMAVSGGNATDIVSGNWFYSAAGNTTFLYSSGSFAYGTNVTGTNPAFVSTTIPGAPACSGTANVPACAATLIANFSPTASGAAAYGYQTPSSSNVTDSLYPAWLCNVSIPSGLVSQGCGTGGPSLTGGFQGNSGSINSLAVGAPAIQQTATGTYSDSVNRTEPDAFGNTASWSSSDGTILNVTSTGLISCVKAGTANSKASSLPGGITFNVWTWTCTGSAPTLTGGFLGASTNTLAVGASAIQFTATGSYSDGANRTLPDVYGNTAAWSASDNTILSVSISGLVSCIAAGTADVIVQSAPGAVPFSHWTMTCTTPTTPTGAYQGNAGSMNLLLLGQAPIQQHVFCSYADAVVLDCTFGDARGNTVTAWTVAWAGIAIGAAGGPTSGQVSTLEEGTVSSGCTVTGGASCSQWIWTVQFPTRTQMPLSGITISGMKTQ